MLPDWRLLYSTQKYVLGPPRLYDPAGGFLQSYGSAAVGPMGLDPDGRSFWASTLGGLTYVLRYDINSGQLLSQWPLDSSSDIFASQTAAYSPPLLGDANVEGTVDSNTSGTAEAFSTQARHPGQVTRLHLYVDSSSTASQALVGVYSDNAGHPGTLQEQATISNLKGGSWNYVDVPPMPIAAGKQYWIAVLAPKGGGTIQFRDTRGGARSEPSVQKNLTALPTTWSAAGTRWASAPLSAYGS